MSWEEFQEKRQEDPVQFSTFNRIINIDPLDEWFDPITGYPLKATQWLANQIAAGKIAEETMIYSQYVMKVETEKNENTFRNSYRPVSMHMWRRTDLTKEENPDKGMLHLVFQGGWDAFGDMGIFAINNRHGQLAERFLPIPGKYDENGYQVWYRQMKEITKTLKFSPPN
jgi:hypothetical protein